MTHQQSDQPPHPGLTIKVDHIDADGVRRTVLPRRQVPADRAPMISSLWPPCACPRCVPGREA